MEIEKKELKKIINEEVSRALDSSTVGFQLAEGTIKEFQDLDQNQQINFLEKLFSYLIENNNI